MEKRNYPMVSFHSLEVNRMKQAPLGSGYKGWVHFEETGPVVTYDLWTSPVCALYFHINAYFKLNVFQKELREYATSSSGPRRI